MLDNGVLTASGFGLDDHTSFVGQSFNLGTVNAGDTLVFVLENLTLGMNAYSGPSLNVSYGAAGYTGSHNHIYSTSYAATSPILDSIPQGTFVAFEDLVFPNSDFNYNDEDFAFVNVTSNVTPLANPEPSTILLLGAGLLLVGGRRGGYSVVLTRANCSDASTHSRGVLTMLGKPSGSHPASGPCSDAS